MIREIKFRGKTSTLPANESHEEIPGLWCYGYLVGGTKGNYYIKESLKAEGFWVVPETIGQFTGLLDKNGREIYEGDILSMDCFKVETGSFTKRMVVHYAVEDSNDGTQWSWFSLTDIGGDGEYSFFRSKKMTILGNIHSNPELLTEK